MTQRDRQASGAVSEAAPRPSTGHASAPRPSVAPAASTDRPPVWEDLYAHANASQQKELLALARRQGVLYAHQLPPTGNGTAPDRARQFLANLFHDRGADLEPVRPAVLEPVDPDLDGAQRDAVARALATPDLCLIQGLPGTGKSRVVAEIVTQAVAKGERVLLLAPTAAALDRVLGQVGSRPTVCAVRCLAGDENAQDLPPGSAALTFAERLRRLAEEAVQGGRREVEAAEQRIKRHHEDEPRFQRGSELIEGWQRLDAQLAALADRQQTLAGVVEREAEEMSAGPFGKNVAGLLCKRREAQQRIDAARATLEGKLSQGRQERDALLTELESLRPLAEAKQSGLWWTGGWWKATLSGNVLAKVTELDGKRQEREAALTGMEEEGRRLGDEEMQAEEAWRAERARQVEAEIARRRAELDQEEAGLQQERKQVQEKWELLLRELAPETPHPATPTQEAVRTALDGWRQQGQDLLRRLAFARDWAAGLEALGNSLPERLASHINLVASTTAGIAADPHFGDASGAVFDLLILEEAHQVTESEFLAAARRARRWAVVGEPEPPEPEATGETQAKPRGIAVPRLSGNPRLFARLWQHLHCDPRSLPYSWAHEGDRLCCRLRSLAAEQRQWLESERVADFPDVELRIFAPPRSRPMLAEVVFPPAMSLAQAKEYIFRELQELPVRAHHHSLRWLEDSDRITLRLCDGDSASAVAVPLEAGVRELIGKMEHEGNGTSSAWHTCALEFERAAGWHRQRAEEWVHLHLGTRDSGRTARLDVPHRMESELAAALSRWLFVDGYRCRGTGNRNGKAAAIEFVAVPPASEGDGRRGDSTPGKPDNGRRPAPTAPRARPSRAGGAGLELDLADQRHRDRLPAELRPLLPAQGLVNYLEAQAVVRSLERLAGDAEFRASSSSVAVIALYHAQVVLIRALIARSAVLAGANLAIRVDLPGAFRHDEAGAVLVSLTRSHHHRAVAFGEGPQALTLALTRPRSRLILFGDAGTLARRAQWEGAVDHLDETTAARERQLVAHLLRWLQGDGGPARTIAVHEGTRS